MGITVDELVDNYPRLYHMANGGSWPMIQQHGLLPTVQIVRTSGIPLAEQEQLLMKRRPISTIIEHPLIGTVTIRDQVPLREQFLSLADMDIQQWLAILNDRVFFWLHPDKLDRLLNARLYRGRIQDVLTLDTRSLVEAYESRVRLSPLNSGATLYPSAPERGSMTFLPLTEYPFKEWRKKRTLPNAITELAVIGGVPDVASHVVAVERRRGGVLLNSLL
jgi:hypothetical protein